MYIFYPFFDHEVAFHSYFVYLLQFLKQHFQFIGSKKSYAFEHDNVRHTAQHVVRSQVEIHLTVSAYGETLYLFIYLCRFFPKFHLNKDIHPAFGEL